MTDASLLESRKRWAINQGDELASHVADVMLGALKEHDIDFTERFAENLHQFIRDEMSIKMGR